MKAIVTGGAGFIGSHLAKRLLKEGWEVLILDNLSSGHHRNIPKGAQFKELDLTYEDAMDELPKEGVHAVFHLASHVGQELSFEEPVYDFKANGLSTIFLLRWCIKYNVKKFIFASSMNVYGDAETECVDEKGEVRPPSPYAVGKIASEYFCQIYQNFGIETTALRLFNVYGPGQDLDNMRQGMVSIYMAFVARREPILIKGSKDRFRDFVFVDDAVDAFYRCLDTKASGKIYNVATGRKTFVWQLIDQIIEAFGQKTGDYPVIYGEPTLQDQFGLYGNAGLIERELGWKPVVALEAGLKIMSAWAMEYVASQRNGKKDLSWE